jgi:hypothetical protein
MKGERIDTMKKTSWNMLKYTKNIAGIIIRGHLKKGPFN